MSAATTKLLLVAGAALCASLEARPVAFEPSAIDPLLPRGFEILPEEAIGKLRAYHFNRALSTDARHDRIEAVFDELPTELLERLPLPPGLERLPAAYKAPFKALHVDRNISWRERATKVRELVAALPVELQRAVAPPQSPAAAGATPAFPSRPPAGFEDALAPSIYAQLSRVHADETTDVATKKARLNSIMRLVPREQLERLPLPPNFERLPAETLSRARQLLHSFELEWDERAAAVARFVAELPEFERRLIAGGLATPPSPAPVAVNVVDSDAASSA